MERNELETFIRFAKSNGMMNWPFEDVVNEYKTTKMHHEEPKFDPKTLQPFDKVLVRAYNNSIWSRTFFGYMGDTCAMCLSDQLFFEPWKQCIPYNEETKHLVGTKEDCPDYYKWWRE